MSLCPWTGYVVSAKVKHSKACKLIKFRANPLFSPRGFHQCWNNHQQPFRRGKNPKVMQWKPRLRSPSPCFHLLMCLSGSVQEQIFQINKAISPSQSLTCFLGCNSIPGTGRHHHFFRADWISPPQVHGLDGILEQRHAIWRGAEVCPYQLIHVRDSRTFSAFHSQLSILEFVFWNVSIFLIYPDMNVLAEKTI